MGTGGSGKTTFLRQIKIQTEGYKIAERLVMKSVITSNIVRGMVALLRAMKKLDLEFENNARQADAVIVEELGLGVEHDQIPVDTIKNLWADAAIQTAFAQREQFHINESFAYFMDSLDRVYEAEYIPIDEDLLRARAPTTGIVEVNMTIRGFDFKIFDVGGQRSERRKWLDKFDDMDATIFVTAVSEYDQNLEEDETVNRIHESMNLFGNIVNSPFFKLTPMIIFFNKRDLFEEKVKTTCIRIAFSDYTGIKDDYMNSMDFIMRSFVELYKGPDVYAKRKAIYKHETCVTDPILSARLFAFVTDIVVRSNLRQAGVV
ncbi:unnamed protein product [Caenorhabditis sp. 36 PRJEB53466]|nr:unnamed protein product [Caenorhabditis sp. 36 PRJEB53466]